jgi:hypothetical protein
LAVVCRIELVVNTYVHGTKSDKFRAVSILKQF